jgi:glycosyltransferase involved in cell wall biosynthesis
MFLVCGMGAGGAERVVGSLANYWADLGWKIEILSYELDPAVQPFYQLDSAVAFRRLSSPTRFGGKIAQVLVRLQGVRRAVAESQPDVVIGILPHASFYATMALLGTGVPVIACEHTDPYRAKLAPWRKFARRLYYSRAAAVVCLLKEHTPYFHCRFVRSIPNPVIRPKTILAQPVIRSGEASALRVVSLGRLEPVKAYHKLITAFGEVAPAHPCWDLVIYGEGPERSRLEALIEALGLSDRVSLPGMTTHPHEVLRSADIFALSSEYEGFPMALCEALSVGLAVVCFEFQTGADQIVRDGVDGLIVPRGDVAALASALSSLMSDDSRRGEMGRRAPEILDRFGLETVTDRWISLFAELESLQKSRKNCRGGIAS